MSSTLWAEVNGDRQRAGAVSSWTRRRRLLDADVLTPPRSAGVLRHPQPAARDRHRRHLRLPARAAAGLPLRGHRPRRRRGVAAGRARRLRGGVFNVHLDTVPSSAGVDGRSAQAARHRRPRHRPGRLRHQGRGGRAAGGGQCHHRRCRVPVLHRRGGQRPALHRRVPRPRPRLQRGDHRRADPLRGGAGASRHQFGAAEVQGRGRACLGRERAECQRPAPGDALGRECAGAGRG